MAEAYEAWRKKKDDVGKEIANVVIYLLGWSKILNVDLESEFLKQIIPKIKISGYPLKIFNSGYKKIYRIYDKNNSLAIRDIITCHDEIFKNKNIKKYTTNKVIKTDKVKTGGGHRPSALFKYNNN